MLNCVIQAQDGASAEALAVGSEGMVGLSAWLGLTEGLEHVWMQTPGEILRVPAAAFRELVLGRAHAEQLLRRFTAYSLRYSAQNCLCHSRHSVKQRLCRWLLASSDRLQSPTLACSQTALAHLLGVRRQAVGEVAVALQRAGLIAYGRAEVRIDDRRGLERLACECYAEVRGLYHRIVSEAL